MKDKTEYTNNHGPLGSAVGAFLGEIFLSYYMIYIFPFIFYIIFEKIEDGHRKNIVSYTLFPALMGTVGAVVGQMMHLLPAKGAGLFSSILLLLFAPALAYVFSKFTIKSINQKMKN